MPKLSHKFRTQHMSKEMKRNSNMVCIRYHRSCKRRVTENADLQGIRT